MPSLLDIGKDILKGDRKIQKKLIKKSIETETKIIAESKAFEKKLLSMKLKVKKEITTESQLTRKNLSTKERKAVYNKFKEKCDTKGCGIKKPQPLDIHHKDMMPGNNKPGNLRLLCPNHHRVEHQKQFLRRHRDMFGNVTNTEIIKKANKG